MVRTQVQLTKAQVQALKHLSVKKKKSLADLVRQSVDRYIAQEADGGQELRVKRSLEAIGMFSSGSTDVSENHDRYLADAFLEK